MTVDGMNSGTMSVSSLVMSISPSGDEAAAACCFELFFDIRKESGAGREGGRRVQRWTRLQSVRGPCQIQMSSESAAWSWLLPQAASSSERAGRPHRAPELQRTGRAVPEREGSRVPQTCRLPSTHLSRSIPRVRSLADPSGGEECARAGSQGRPSGRTRDGRRADCGRPKKEEEGMKKATPDTLASLSCVVFVWFASPFLVRLGGGLLVGDCDAHPNGERLPRVATPRLNAA